LDRGYSVKSSLKLVGDHYTLTDRQRLAVSRAACSDAQLGRRKAKEIPVSQLAQQALIIDGFNLIITMEAAMSGGVLLRCRDGCIRDLSGVHGSYRSVDETENVIRVIGQSLSQLRSGAAHWVLDSPVSNSGRLASLIQRMANENQWIWTVELAYDPDRIISSSSAIVISSDSRVLDDAVRWTNLAHHLVAERLLDSWVIDLDV
jgi:hypothetical protein